MARLDERHGVSSVRCLSVLLRPAGAIIAAVIGIAFFFVIIGVFGLPASIAALIAFIVLALIIFRHRQIELEP